jgi:hypothetical protein
MKTLALSLLAVAGLALVGWQHQQLGQLSGENATLQQSAAEADHLKADLAKFNDAQAQDAAAEIDRLHEENRDLLKLRNEVNQLRDTRAEFQKVSAENQRLRSQPRPTPQPVANQTLIQPIVININALYDRGFNTPEDAVQTFYWARRDGNVDALSRCMTQPSSQYVRDYLNQPGKPASLENILSIEIAARRDIDANTVQLGLVIHTGNDPRWDKKVVYTLTLRNGEWKLDRKSLNQ